MIKQIKWVLPLLFTIGVIVTLLWIVPKEEERYKQKYEYQLQDLGRENTYLKQKCMLLDQMIEVLELINDSLSVQMEKHQVVLEDLKAMQHKKNGNVDEYATEELYQFFTE